MRLKNGKDVACKICGEVFYAQKYLIDKGFGLYCSRKCSYKAKVGKKASLETRELMSRNYRYHSWNKGLKGYLSDDVRKLMSNAKKGKKLSDDHRKKVIKTLNFGLNEKHPLWKGDSVSYFGLHAWIVRKLGKPNKCEFCGTTKKKRYHWASLSHKAKRDLSDYVRLCPSCHKKYDTGILTQETSLLTAS